MKFCALASGSTGNSYYIGNEKGGILVDAGISAKAVEHGLLHGAQVVAQQLQGILLTHEHSDHIKGVGALARRYQLPIYASQGTWEGVGEKLGKLKQEQKNVLVADEIVEIAGMQIQGFSISHDATEPLSYTVCHEGKKIGIATDTGEISMDMVERLYNSNIIILESNHDEHLVRTGPYPYYLKQRILSQQGHLSNHACGMALQEMIGQYTEHIVLAHLSQENNHPNLAHQTVKDLLMQGSLTGRVHLWVAKPLTYSVPLKI